MLRRGFTLIELLVVITIIAILAGAAIPYVADYVEEARYSKAKSDLDEIASALTRFELDRGTSYTATDLSELVGPYLQKSLVDPWGGPYVVSDAKSQALTYGPDKALDGGDDITTDFRPPLALSKAYWEDSNGDGAYSDADSIVLRFTRPVAANAAAVLALGTGANLSLDTVAATNGWIDAPNPWVSAAAPGSYTSNMRGLKLTVGTAANGAVAPGKTILSVGVNTAFADGNATAILTAPKVLIKAR